MSSHDKTPRRRSTDRLEGKDARPLFGSGQFRFRPDDPVISNRDEVGRVRHDANGNGVWEWSYKLQRRRKDDQDLDYVKYLGGDDLALTHDDAADDEFNPYHAA